MRDAFGGTFMIYLFMIFLVLYITFVAVAFNYARAFKVKDKVMDIIEQNEGMDFDDETGEIGKIETYLKSINYDVGYVEDKCEGYDYINNEYGYCVKKDSTGLGDIYSVKTFIKIDFGFMDIDFTIPVKGETRKIERIS